MNTVTINRQPNHWNRSGKITPHHLDRRAVIYVRQSTLQQVHRHQESTRLQYGLVDQAARLGHGNRSRLLMKIWAVQVHRHKGGLAFNVWWRRLVWTMWALFWVWKCLACHRSSRDWHQLLEVCAIFGTLIGDLDGVYDPTLYNDRLLLGLKGTMSEAELHILKQRMLEGKRAKARRGDLGMQVPIGYIRHPSGEVTKDPDEQAQGVIARVFELFERKRTINGVLQAFVEQRIQMPYRLAGGPNKWALVWRRPNRTTLSNLLHNPIYAGAYVYGRRPTDVRKKVPGRPSTGRTVAPAGEWEVLIKDRLPAYISWEQYERNIAQMEANMAQVMGAVRQGPSLLSGLIVCGRCGLRMSTRYSDNGKGLRYGCDRMAVDYGEAHCQALSGNALDACITTLIMQALEPSSLEISLKVAEDIEGERRQHQAHWQQRLERAHIDAERAFRQYNAVEPENRLVARTLERQ